MNKEITLLENETLNIKLAGYEESATVTFEEVLERILQVKLNRIHAKRLEQHQKQREYLNHTQGLGQTLPTILPTLGKVG